MTNLPLSSPDLPDPPEQLRAQVEQAIAGSRVVLFMKGSPELPACGFSRLAADTLRAEGVEFEWVDVLVDPRLRQQLTSISKWPTIPQLFVDGELVGGADIIGELHRTGELSELLYS